MTARKKLLPPSRLYVSWCTKCGMPICAGRTRREADASGCDCIAGSDRVEIYAVTVTPPRSR